MKHFCYLITFGEKKLLFTADLDYISEDLSRLQGIHLDGVFVNPLFFSVLCHRRFFRGTLETGHLVVYHIPFAEDDTMAMLPILDRNLARWSEDRGTVTALREPFQQVCF